MLFKCVLTLFVVSVGLAAARLYGQAPAAVANNQRQTVPDYEKESYLVYAAYLKQHPWIGYPVIQEKVNPHSYTADSDLWGAKFSQAAREQMPSVKQSTLDDYFAKAGKSLKLVDAFAPEIRVVVVSEAEIDKVFEGYEPPAPWKKFYAKFPGAGGLYWFSLVGFNPERTQAFMFAASQRDAFHNRAEYVLLEKEGRTWIVKQSMLIVGG